MDAVRGLEHVVVQAYSLRHFRASILINQNVDLKTLQYEMGHSDPAFTLRKYGHIFRDQKEINKRKTLQETIADELGVGR